MAASSATGAPGRTAARAVDLEVLLRAALRGTSTLAGCAARTCDVLVRVGLTMPSVYIERSGRLHCYASRGYWQVLSGIPLELGVVGEVMRSGRTAVHEVAECDHFLAAEPEISGGICAPITGDAGPIGVLSVESRGALPDGARELVERAAACLSDRIAELGGRPRTSGWRLLADATALLNEGGGIDALTGHVAAMAAELARLSSAVVVTFDPADPDDGPSATACGPLAAALLRTPPATLREIGTWVEGPRSCFTVADPQGARFEGHDALIAAGVRTVAVVSIVAYGDRHGYLLVGDERRTRVTMEAVEQLEVLGSLAAGAIEHRRQLDRLADLGRRDPLTGLLHARALTERLERRHGSHAFLALLVVDVDHFKRVNDERGHAAGDRALLDVTRAMSAAMRASDQLYRTGGDEFTAVLDVDHVDEAVEVAERMRAAAAATGHPVSIGVAIVDPATDPDVAVQMADQALYAAKRAGRDEVRLG